MHRSRHTGRMCCGSGCPPWMPPPATWASAPRSWHRCVECCVSPSSACAWGTMQSCCDVCSPAPCCLQVVEVAVVQALLARAVTEWKSVNLQQLRGNFMRCRQQTPTGSCASRCASCWATWTASTQQQTRCHTISCQPQTGRQFAVDWTLLGVRHLAALNFVVHCGPAAARLFTKNRPRLLLLAMYRDNLALAAPSACRSHHVPYSNEPQVKSAAVCLLPAGTCSAGQRPSQRSCGQPTRTTSLPASTRQAPAHVTRQSEPTARM